MSKDDVMLISNSVFYLRLEGKRRARYYGEVYPVEKGLSLGRNDLNYLGDGEEMLGRYYDVSVTCLVEYLGKIISFGLVKEKRKVNAEDVCGCIYCISKKQDTDIHYMSARNLPINDLIVDVEMICKCRSYGAEYCECMCDDCGGGARVKPAKREEE